MTAFFCLAALWVVGATVNCTFVLYCTPSYLGLLTLCYAVVSFLFWAIRLGLCLSLFCLDTNK
jgi:hypothetical protein